MRDEADLSSCLLYIRTTWSSQPFVISTIWFATPDVTDVPSDMVESAFGDSSPRIATPDVTDMENLSLPFGQEIVDRPSIKRAKKPHCIAYTKPCLA